MIRYRMRSTSRLVALAVLAFVALILGAADASAKPVLPRDGDGHVIVEMTVAGDGISGTLSVINPTSHVMSITIKGVGRIANCTFASATVKPLSVTDVDVKSETCELDKNGEIASVTFAGDPKPIKILLKLKDVDKAVSLGASLFAFLFAAIGAGVLLLALWFLRPTAAGTRLGRSDEVTGAPAGWTFKESWATNVGAVSTVFVAIFGTNDVVKALVGDESKTLPGRLLIIAGISGLLLGVAPLVLKAIGPKSSTATVLGLLVAGWLTATAIAGQVLAVYVAFGVDKPKGSAWTDFRHGFGWDGPLAVTVVLIALLGWYVWRTIYALLDPAVAPPTPSDELLVASATLVAAQICCKDGTPSDSSTDLLDEAYVRAVHHLERRAGKVIMVKEELADGRTTLMPRSPKTLGGETLDDIRDRSKGRRDPRSALL